MENTSDSQNVPEAALGGEPGDQGGADELQPALTPGQEVAIAALVGEPTYAKAAKAAGVGVGTLHYSCRGHEMADIDGRLSELEDRIEAISQFVADANKGIRAKED